MTLPVIDANFNDIIDGRIRIYRHDIPTYITLGSLVILTTPATATTKYATLYETTEDYYHFRIQD